MKKVVLMLLSVACLMMSNTQITFGPKAGLNISSIEGKNVYGYKVKKGFYIGGEIMMLLKKSLAIQTELYF